MSAKHLTRVFVLSGILSSAWLFGCGSDPAFVLQTDSTNRFANSDRSSPTISDGTTVANQRDQDALPSTEIIDDIEFGDLEPTNVAEQQIAIDSNEPNPAPAPVLAPDLDPDRAPAPDRAPSPDPISDPVPDPDRDRAPAPAPAPAPSPAPIIVDPVQACSERGTSQFDLSVARHQDVEAGLRDRYKSSYPISDAAASEIVHINLDDITGNVLPVTTFGLDDIAVIVNESTRLEDIVDWNETTKTRDIYIPEHALLVFDGNNPNYASGAVDSGATTNYHFYNHSVNLPGGQSHSLRAVYEMGVPLIAHNQVGLSELRELGFVNNEGDVVFKIIHVAHGHGFVQLQFTLNPCQE